MKRFLIHLSVAALSFLASLSIYKASYIPTSPTNINEPPRVSFCELERDPNRYDGKMISVRAILYRDSSYPFIYDWSCSSSDANSSLHIRVLDETNRMLPDWVIGGTFCAHDAQAKYEGLHADVIVVGIFESHYFAPHEAPNGKHFRIIPSSIYQLSQPYRR
jgi:hypothetical protein